MYRRELNSSLALCGACGLLLVLAGARTLVAGLVLLTLVSVAGAWIVMKDRLGMHRSRRDGLAVLVALPAGWLSRLLSLRRAGVRDLHWPATEYHMRPDAGEGVGVLRKAIKDIEHVTARNAVASLHIFAWRGMTSGKVERLVRPILRPGDRLTTWQRGDVAFGVAILEGRKS